MWVLSRNFHSWNITWLLWAIFSTVEDSRIFSQRHAMRSGNKPALCMSRIACWVNFVFCSPWFTGTYVTWMWNYLSVRNCCAQLHGSTDKVFFASSFHPELAHAFYEAMRFDISNSATKFNYTDVWHSENNQSITSQGGQLKGKFPEVNWMGRVPLTSIILPGFSLVSSTGIHATRSHHSWIAVVIWGTTCTVFPR